MSGFELRVTVRGGASATWFVRDGVIHVTSVRRPDGTETELPDTPSLGESFDAMPRALWDQISYEFESSRRPAPGWHGWPQ
ncbi:hypothetical protein [Nocardia australiensis]|uniref:hypothetical protein n=1 Tax=Nocardia australiensis TaxID=2887191 RepID=UPI001D14640F|nr:hypothetical protein [Nocardia australiensis]